MSSVLSSVTQALQFDCESNVIAPPDQSANVFPTDGDAIIIACDLSGFSSMPFLVNQSRIAQEHNYKLVILSVSDPDLTAEYS